MTALNVLCSVVFGFSGLMATQCPILGILNRKRSYAAARNIEARVVTRMLVTYIGLSSLLALSLLSAAIVVWRSLWLGLVLGGWPLAFYTFAVLWVPRLEKSRGCRIRKNN